MPNHQFKSPVAERFVNNLMLDLFPQTSAEIVDFGFNHAQDQQMLFAAYKHALKTGQASAEDFDKAVGDGSALTVLISATDPEMTVQTDYDFMGYEE